jgi:hypothetical protein
MPWSIAILVALPFLFSICPAGAEPSHFTVEGVYFFGCDGFDVNKVRQTVAVHAGDEFEQYQSQQVVKEISASLKSSFAQEPTDVAVVNCGHQHWNIYVGLGGHSVEHPTYNPEPKENLELPQEAMDLFESMMHRWMEVVDNGGCGEDLSKGYSLASDPDLGAIELRVRDWTLTHEDLVGQVLSSSANWRQRFAAATLLGYADPSKKKIDALLHAAMDENVGVRNNAVRALVACSKSGSADRIQPEPFISMLNAPTWTDRNKAVFVISGLTENEGATLLPKLRDKALQSLCEMAYWDTPHAFPARLLLGQIAGLSTDQITKLVEANDVDAIVAAAKSSAGATDSHSNSNSDTVKEGQ